MLASKLLFFISLSIFSAVRADAACLDAREANAIRSEIAVEIAGTKKTDLCDANSKAYKLFETLLFIKNIRFKNRQLDSHLDQGLLARGFWTYLNEQGLKRIVESNDTTCARPDVYGYVDQQNKPNVITLCPLFFDKKAAVPDRVQLLLHESRHFDGHSHVDCRSGFWKGTKQGCDESIQAKGSYAVSAESMARVGLLSTNLSKAARASSKLLALGYSQNRFNQPVFRGSARAVYLTDTDNRAFLYNGKSLYSTQFIEDAAIVSLQSAVNVFPHDRMDSAFVLNVFAKESDDATPAQNALTKQYNAIEPASRPEIVDLVSVGDAMCFVQPFTVNCTRAATPSVTYTSPRQLAKAFLPEEIGAPRAKDTLYLVDDSKRLAQLLIQRDGSFTIKTTNQRLDGFQAVVRFNGSRLAIRSNGELVSEKAGAWIPAAGAQGRKFQTMSRSFFWSPAFYEDD